MPQRILNRDRHTLEAIFRHPVSSNIAWSDALHLTDRLGTARQEHNGRLLLEIGEQRHVFHQPHAKALTPEEVVQLRRFLESAGATPASVEVVEEERAAESSAESPTLDMVVAIDHHQTRLFTIAGASETARTLRPYDPYHFLHHLSHRQDRELRGQREPEEPGYYSAIAAALAPARRIVLLGHGTGHTATPLRISRTCFARSILKSIAGSWPRRRWIFPPSRSRSCWPSHWRRSTCPGTKHRDQGSG